MNNKNPEVDSVQPTLEPLLTSSQAGRYFDKSEAGMAQWRHHGIGPRYLVLGKRTVRYRESDIAAYVAENVRDGGASVA